MDYEKAMVVSGACALLLILIGGAVLFMNGIGVGPWAFETRMLIWKYTGIVMFIGLGTFIGLMLWVFFTEPR